MNIRFDGKTVLVTGGASGMGRAAALRFGSLGANVAVATDRNIEGARATAESICREGGHAFVCECNVAEEATVERTVNEIVSRCGRLDIAFNNAGLGVDRKRIHPAPITDLSLSDYDALMNVNLRGVFLCMKYELRQMKRQGGGVVVNNASLGALSPKPGDSAYAASKSGVLAFTKVGALEMGEFGVRVNAICPGATSGTDLLASSTGGDEAILERIRSGIPLQRLGTVADIADTVCLLCSDYASFLNGVIIPVDGGLILR